MKRGATRWKGRAWIALIMSVALVPLAIARAQEEPKPCGTITKSVRLTSDCLAPLVVGANNLTVDLNGYTVIAAAETGVEIFDKRGVTVKNGTIKGLTTGLYVKGGHHNKFRNLVVDIDVGEGSPVVVVFENVRDVRVQGLKAFAFEDVGGFWFQGKRSKLSGLSLSNVDGAKLAVIRGSKLTISNSTIGGGAIFKCSGAVMDISNSIVRGNSLLGDYSSGLCLTGDNNIIKHNVISSYSSAGLTLEGGQGNTIANNQIVTKNEKPPEVVDVDGGPTACENTWRNNDFTTDSEGDGPNAGCIR